MGSKTTASSKKTVKTSSVTEPLKKIKILVVDDDEDIAVFLKKGLERGGFEVEVYTDPRLALSSFKPGVYDLLLLDIRMPGMTGFELYEKISKIDSNAKVCFLTAFETYKGEFKKSFPSLNEITCYIKKPVTINDLIKRIKPMLESK